MDRIKDLITLVKVGPSSLDFMPLSMFTLFEAFSYILKIWALHSEVLKKDNAEMGVF